MSRSGPSRKVCPDLIRVLRMARIEAKLTQDALAAAIFVSRDALRSWEGGYRSPSFPVLERWARGLGYEIKIVRTE